MIATMQSQSPPGNTSISTASGSTSSSIPTFSSKYRGAVIEDLQLPPAFALPSTEPVSRVIELAYERDFSCIPVLSKNRRPLGYVEVSNLKKLWEEEKALPTDKVSSHMVRFNRSSSEPYTLITPLTPLDELEVFLTHNSGDFALVTDASRKFVLGVATMQDLEDFVKRRG